MISYFNFSIIRKLFYEYIFQIDTMNILSEVIFPLF